MTMNVLPESRLLEFQRLCVQGAAEALPQDDAEYVQYVHDMASVLNEVLARRQADVSLAATLHQLRENLRNPRLLHRRKEWVSGQQYSYVLMEEVEAMMDEVDTCIKTIVRPVDATPVPTLTPEELDRLLHWMPACYRDSEYATDHNLRNKLIRMLNVTQQRAETT